MCNVIVALCKNGGIGYNHQLPWHLSNDLKHFAELTDGHTVIMGRETYFSIPEKSRPLKNRTNIVLTHHPENYTYDNENLKFINPDSQYLTQLIESCPYIIGGLSIYNLFLYTLGTYCNKIYVTLIDKEYKCDQYIQIPPDYKLVNVSESMYDENEKCNYRYLEYIPSKHEHQEYNYLHLVNDIIDHGNMRSDRTGTGTKSSFGCQLQFDLRESLPMITTKFVPFKMIVKELLWFLSGQTDNKILNKQGVHIWDGNTTREFLDHRGLEKYDEGDIGPMYGWQWRHFGATYRGSQADYTNQGIDQLEEVVNLLKTDPYSRRIAMTTYNVNDLEKGVLHPCHGIFVQFYVHEENGTKYLSCHMLQRSVDMGCGLPFNITSYAMLTNIIAMKTNMKPDKLIISTGDTHVYLNHIDQLKIQLSRIPYPFPILKINPEITNKSWENIKVEDFEIIGYISHQPIKLALNV